MDRWEITWGILQAYAIIWFLKNSRSVFDQVFESLQFILVALVAAISLLVRWAVPIAIVLFFLFVILKGAEEGTLLIGTPFFVVAIGALIWRHISKKKTNTRPTDDKFSKSE